MIINTETLELAERFYNELDEAFEVLTDIAHEFGPRTLSGCMYLWRAIQTGSFIDDWHPEMNVSAVMERLPSGHVWQEYIRVFVDGDQRASCALESQPGMPAVIFTPGDPR